MERSRYDFIISRNTKNDNYSVWKFDPHSKRPLTKVTHVRKGAQFKGDHSLQPVGDYLIEWGPLQLEGYSPCYPYRLFKFDPDSKDPLAAEAVKKGIWTRKKFFGSRADFGNPDGAIKKYSAGGELVLVPMGSFMLNLIPTAGRGTFHLWNFDPASDDPLPQPYTPQGAFETIQEGHELMALDGYVLDWVPETGAYYLWSFDPQAKMPLARPTIQQGKWDSIDKKHQLVPIGNYILDWMPSDGSFRLWEFDAKQANPLTGPVNAGKLPKSFSPDTTLVGVQPTIPVEETRENEPGTVDFMRSKIKKVVYLMLENRSFDHACGWLYENDVPAKIIGPQEPPFKGASKKFFNYNGKKKAHLKKYKQGKLSEDYKLDMPEADPYHDNSDVMRQLFYKDDAAYANGETPNMGGFVWNNGTEDVMLTYTPDQLPILTGLAKCFAVSDEWFCSMPGGTDVNRAFSLTGSSLGMLNNFQNGAEYLSWASLPHRSSIWKVLWSNGFTDWKIYNSVEWFDFVFTYHLFLQGQIPTVDEDVDKKLNNYVASHAQFIEDALAGALPAFSYLEPTWIAMTGTTSYHPGGDLVPGEKFLNDIFNALQEGPDWEETLLIITFDEHGGIYDHVPPDYVENPYPNDRNDGFEFDLLGVRVPTLLISPWISEKTVFRSETGVRYDSTSILATLLEWYGIPQSRWGLGQRTNHAPTFEGVLREKKPRRTDIDLVPPYDKDNPKDKEANTDLELHDLHRVMAERLIHKLAHGKLQPLEIQKIADDILAKSDTMSQLHQRLKELEQRLKAT